VLPMGMCCSGDIFQAKVDELSWRHWRCKDLHWRYSSRH
jgi:hypothetical protein